MVDDGILMASTIKTHAEAELWCTKGRPMWSYDSSLHGSLYA